MNEISIRLEEYYNSFLLSVPKIALAIFIVIVGIIASGWITDFFGRKIQQRSHDQLMSKFLSKALRAILIVVILLLALNIAGLSSIAGAIMATAGASAIVVGFAFKDIAENFLAGIILAFNRPFQVNDTVQIEDVFGKVLAMEFRYTKIATFDGRSVYIPNSDVLTKPVYNYTEDGFYRLDFIVGIAYENDIEKAKQIILACLQNDTSLVHDEAHISFVVEDELAASTVNLKVYFWVETKDFRRNALEIRGRLMQTVKSMLEAQDFNLPGNITELKFYNASGKFPIETFNEKDKS